MKAFWFAVKLLWTAFCLGVMSFLIWLLKTPEISSMVGPDGTFVRGTLIFLALTYIIMAAAPYVSPQSVRKQEPAF